MADNFSGIARGLAGRPAVPADTRGRAARPCILAAAGALASLAFTLPGEALANGYQDLHQSAQGLGTAYAVNGAGITDITAMFSNPASIARFDGSWAAGVASIILPKDTFEDLRATAPFSGAPVTGTPATPEQFLDNAPGAGAFVTHQLSDRVFFGLAFTVPWATKSSYPDTAVSRYTAVDTRLRAYNLNPVIAYKASDTVSFAVGPAFQLYTADFSTAVDPTGGIAASPANDLLSRIKAHDTSVGFTAGMEWQATPTTRVGISYRSRIAHKFDGDLALTSANPASFARLDAGVLAVTGRRLTGPTANADFKINTPSIATFGIAQTVTPKLDLYASAQLVGWHFFRDTRVTYDNGLPETVVDNNWHDSWYVAGGFGYRASDAVQLRAGIAYDWTPTPDRVRNPRAPNADRIYAGAGATYQPRDSGWKVDVAYGHTFFKDAPIDLAGGNNLPRGTLHGISKIDANIFMAQFTMNLDRIFR